MTPRRIAVLPIALLLAFVAGCRRAPVSPAADPNTVIATWDGGQATRGEIADALARRLGRGPAASTREARRAWVRQIVERRARIEMLLRLATASGLAKAPTTSLRIAARQDALLADDLIAASFGKDTAVPEARVAEELARRQKESAQEAREFSHIFLRAAAADAAAVTSANDRMRQILQELSEGQAFEEMARRYSDSITARGGGRVPPTGARSLNKTVRAAVFSQKEGELGEIVTTPEGLHLFRVDRILHAAPTDAAALRESIRAQMREEAARVAADAARTRALDEAGVKIDPAALEREPSPIASVLLVASGGGVDLSLGDYDELERAGIAVGESRLYAARGIAANRLLAARRRTAPIGPDLANALKTAEQNEVVVLQRAAMIAKEPIAAVSEAEERALYDVSKGTEPQLQERVVDLLFFRQEGDSVADVYREGELVGKALREGKTFDAVLAGWKGGKGAVTERGLSGVDLVEVRRESSRVADELQRLRPGQVSEPIYMDGESVRFGSLKPIVDRKGLLFLRLVAERPFSFEKIRPRLKEAVKSRKQGDVIAAIKKRLDDMAKVRILVPEG